MIMSENENLMDREKLFPHAKYIIGKDWDVLLLVIETDKADMCDVNWDGRLQRLRDYLDVTVETQSKYMH
jgi:hypothetical protein